MISETRIFVYFSKRLFVGSLGLVLATCVTARVWAEPVFDVFNPQPDLEKTADGKWKVNDETRPLPPAATPKAEAELAQEAKAPADAIQLLGDPQLSKWKVPQFWVWKEGMVEIVPGMQNLQTVDSFGSCHLHVEWTTPEKSDHTGQGRGNSGIFLMGRYEIQVLDTFDNKTYADGTAGSLYGVKPPDVNALRPSGQWQYYDIWFRRPTFNAAGEMLTPAAVTIYVNGVLVQNNVAFEGPTSNKKRTPYSAHEDKIPLQLQYHNESVKYRNIWIVPLADDQVISPSGPVGLVRVVHLTK